MPSTIVTFRQDLRLEDNDALIAAIERGNAIVPVYIFDDAGEGRWPLGAASRSWLHRSLASLDASLRAKGSRLIFARGDTATELRRIAKVSGADAVYWSRRYEAAARAHDARVAKALTADGLSVCDFGGTLLFEPDEIRNRQGGPFQVFTPFWRTCLTLEVAPPRRLTRSELPAPTRWPASLALDALELRPSKVEPAVPAGFSRWDEKFYVPQPVHNSSVGCELARNTPPWLPGEAGARQRLRAFIRTGIVDYGDTRDFPATDGTSMLSPHLHFGELSPRQVWSAVRELSGDSGVFPPHNGAAVFLKELGWREFAYHLLAHFPHTPERPLREAFARFPWRKDPGDRLLTAWKRGRTGYPIVDAGMRQLWQTGWMHNRVRMIAASFLVKHLRLPWQLGAQYFWDTLVDADLAANTLNWQWSAGCGADAVPYFRIFAPVTQGKKFDADGTYVRRWVPELAKVPTPAIHAAWEHPALAGIQLGKDYPHPIVDHTTARAEALAAFRQLRTAEG